MQKVLFIDRDGTIILEPEDYFNYKLLLITSMIIFPFLVVLFLHFSLYDGIRHLLWTLPYFCIIPGLTIYYLIENIKFNTFFGTQLRYF